MFPINQDYTDINKVKSEEPGPSSQNMSKQQEQAKKEAQKSSKKV